jgi:hypothetical protein
MGKPAPRVYKACMDVLQLSPQEVRAGLLHTLNLPQSDFLLRMTVVPR